uniref:Protein kinase domain-containing protein n=1 Tax=Clytia hemisphaerica TaxID=252671 RepID=A0A7M5UTU5_9CNID
RKIIKRNTMNNGGEEKQLLTIWIEPKKDGSNKVRDITTNTTQPKWAIHTADDKEWKSDFSANNNLVLSPTENGDGTQSSGFPKASLLKYEIRHLTNLKQIEGPEQFLSKNTKNPSVPITEQRENEKADGKSDSEDENMTERLRSTRYSSSRNSDDLLGRSSYRSTRTSYSDDIGGLTRGTSAGSSRYRRSVLDDPLDTYRSSRSSRRLDDYTPTTDYSTTSSSRYDRPYRSTTSADETRSYRTTSRRTLDDPVIESPRRSRRSKVNGIDTAITTTSVTATVDGDCNKCKEKQERIIQLENDKNKEFEKCKEKDLRIEELEKQCSRDSEKRKEKDERIQDLIKELKNLSEDVKSKQELVKDLESELKTQRTNYDQKLNDLQSLESEFVEQEEIQIRMEKDLNDREERIEQLEHEIQVERDTIKSKEDLIEELTIQLEELKETLEMKEEKILELEKDFENASVALMNGIKQMEQQPRSGEDIHELEAQLQDSLDERDGFMKEIKKLERELKKINNSLEEEKNQTRRLGIKLEDANYEIGRLRQELINSQLENEKIVEENEDLAVDNEDLIKERDEIIQIYEELYRESERLKHEVKIWKTVFDNNKDNIDEDEMREAMSEGDALEENGKESSDEEELIELEEDQSLLVPPRDDIRIKVTDVSKAFEQSEEISRGKFGKVYKMVARATGDTYAAKYIKVTPKLREDVLNTIDIMKKIHHVRLMNLFDVYDLGSQIVMILEYVGGGMLFERIVEKNSLTEAECALYIKQVLQGLHHLHLQNIAHLELKPENIICVNRSNMDIKIIDFGLAKQLSHDKPIKITAGSPEFVAPEILSFDPVSLNSDLWSVGVITYILLSGISPFIGDDDNDTLMNVSCGEYEYDDQAFGQITNDAKSFIDKLLVSNPKKRGNVGRCLQHPWINSNWQSKQSKINLGNLKTFLKKHKEKVNVSARGAIRRFSSFGVGGHAHGLLGGRGGSPVSVGSSRSPSKHLLVPNALQSCVINEDEEEEEEADENQNIRNINDSLRSGPIFTVTKEAERPPSGDYGEALPDFNTDTPDGLRNYLQQMINTGLLPGRSGPPDMSEQFSDEDH